MWPGPLSWHKFGLLAKFGRKSGLNYSTSVREELQNYSDQENPLYWNVRKDKEVFSSDTFRHLPGLFLCLLAHAFPPHLQPRSSVQLQHRPSESPLVQKLLLPSAAINLVWIRRDNCFLWDPFLMEPACFRYPWPTTSSSRAMLSPSYIMCSLSGYSWLQSSALIHGIGDWLTNCYLLFRSII